ncbi:hypothetical protein QQY24_19800 [Streptomyces sp. TG1A-8]|uniref:CDI toxin immunity protein n=1 Tax=Streptomyces sp. TG1A-8 TaxID=3051385 RepID=UPI00265BBE62|nr:hypothetical protein [Streptomyces sp. TG1A-8]MDO0927547.1 hypothetical protein [Streptomyces sp. TG1A-8]
MAPSSAYGSGRRRLDDLLDSLHPGERDQFMILEAAEDEAFTAMSLDRFPQTSWTGIDWERAAFSEQVFTSGETEAAGLVGSWLSRMSSDDSLVVVFWGNARVPAVAMASRCAARHAEEILGTSDDLWLFVEDEGLLIEHTHDGRLTLGRVPPSV